MKCYISDSDDIGSIDVRLFQTRVFRGDWAGFWEVMPIVPRGAAFGWHPKKAVMDDFGNLVAVGG